MNYLTDTLPEPNGAMMALVVITLVRLWAWCNGGSELTAMKLEKTDTRIRLWFISVLTYGITALAVFNPTILSSQTLDLPALVHWIGGLCLISAVYF